MRLLLFTGKGGVGKTTASAATAAAAAARGSKTLVLSTDPAHSLADALGVRLGGQPTEVDTGLYGMQVDAQAAFERTWRDIQLYLVDVLARAGVTLDPGALLRLVAIVDGTVVNGFIEADPDPRAAARAALLDVLGPAGAAAP